MNTAALPGPSQQRIYTEHEAADPARLQSLLDAIPDRRELLAALHGRHVLSMRHFDRDLLVQLFRLAAEFEAGYEPASSPLAGRILASAFLDDPTSRTLFSFRSAWLRLGGGCLPVGEMYRQFSSHPAAMVELAELCNSHSDVALIRTPVNSPLVSKLPLFRIPVVNAGDGIDENPTHAMADLYTLFKWRPDLLGDSVSPDLRIQVAVSGWPAQSRMIRSLLLGLAKFAPAISRVVVLGRQAQMFSEGQAEELARMGLRIEAEKDFSPELTLVEGIKAVVPDMDVVYVDRGHQNLSRQAILEAFEALKPNALMFHSELRPDELAEQMDNSPHNGYFAQQRGAVYLRMALMACIMGVAL